MRAGFGTHALYKDSKMGDWFQTIVDRDATVAEAEQLSKRVVTELVKRGIVSPTLTDCVLGSDLGYPPGSNYLEAVEEQDGGFLDLWTNGLDIIVGRTVFDSGQGGFQLICGQCSSRVDYAGPSKWSDAVEEWYDGKGAGIFVCPICNYSQAITEWQFDPPWGFGNLGLTFWNWPPLKENFVKEMGILLEHRTIYVAGKL